MLRLAAGGLIHCGKRRNVLDAGQYFKAASLTVQAGEPLEEAKVLDGDDVLLEFDEMAKYTKDHLSSKPSYIHEYYRPKNQSFARKTPQEVEDWVTEWESIKLAWDACAQTAIDCDRLEIRTIAAIINRCKTGGYCNNSLLLDLVTKILGDHALNRFTIIQISMIVQSLGMLARDARDEEEGERNLFNKHVVVNHGEESGSPTAETAVDFFTNTCCKFTAALLEDFVQQGIIPSKCTVRDLSSITHGLGLQFPHELMLKDLSSDVEDWAAAFGLEFRKKARYPTCLPIDYSNILHGLANLQCKKSVNGICWLLERSLEGRDFEQQAITNIVWSLGKLNMGSQVVFDRLGKHITLTVKTFINQGLSNTVYGLGLRYRDGGISLERTVLRVLADEIIKQHRIRAFNSQDFFSIVYGFGLLGFRDGDVVDALVSEINRRVRQRRERRERAKEKRANDEQGKDGGSVENDADEEDIEDDDVWPEHQMIIMQHALGR
ncbi:hypothetical protein BSKO_12264 [Bryopsis sp. KO-2023]|nr:hypothetical protein BSKO_12264 [Bryopsis sp. KO-2023]